MKDEILLEQILDLMSLERRKFSGKMKYTRGHSCHILDIGSEWFICYDVETSFTVRLDGKYHSTHGGTAMRCNRFLVKFIRENNLENDSESEEKPATKEKAKK